VSSSTCTSNAFTFHFQKTVTATFLQPSGKNTSSYLAILRVDQPNPLHHLTLHFVAVGTLVANAEMIPGGTLCTKTSQAAAKPAQSYD